MSGAIYENGKRLRVTHTEGFYTRTVCYGYYVGPAPHWPLHVIAVEDSPGHASSERFLPFSADQLEPE